MNIYINSVVYDVEMITTSNTDTTINEALHSVHDASERMRQIISEYIEQLFIEFSFELF